MDLWISQPSSGRIGCVQRRHAYVAEWAMNHYELRAIARGIRKSLWYGSGMVLNTHLNPCAVGVMSICFMPDSPNLKKFCSIPPSPVSRSISALTNMTITNTTSSITCHCAQVQRLYCICSVRKKTTNMTMTTQMVLCRYWIARLRCSFYPSASSSARTILWLSAFESQFDQVKTAISWT